ncbi:MAG: phospholipid carrier-dependent glycosyltransferase [Clostridia bacterium]
MKSFKKFVCLSVVLLILTSSVVQAFAIAGPQLAKNPGFEETNGKSPLQWKPSFYANKGAVSSDATVKHSGDYSVLINNKSNDHSKITQKILVEPNTIYHFSCWVKTENVKPISEGGTSPDLTNNKGANITIDGSADSYSDKSAVNTSDWTLLEMYRKTDAVTTELGVQLAVGGYGSTVAGKAWFDDMIVEKVDTAPVAAPVITFFGKSSAATSDDLMLILLVIGLGILIVGGIAAYLIFLSKKKSKSTSPVGGPTKLKTNPTQITESMPTLIEKTKLSLRDFIIMGVCTLLYAAFAFTNLGSLSVPETGWMSQTSGDSFVIELPKEISTNRAGFYLGYGNATYQLEYMDANGAYQPFASYEKKEGELFKWVYLNGSTQVTTKKFKMSVDYVGGSYTDIYHNGTLNEIAFFTTDPSTKLYTQIDISGAKAIEPSLMDTSSELPAQNYAALFDEQNKVSAYASYFNGFYFDEIYHARTAYENIHDIPVYETTHPPLGKLLISVGIRIFGMNPFGWRCMGTLFGVLMLPLMYLFGLKLFRRRYLAFAAMFLMTVDFMHFSLSRIATIDIYGTFFVLLMYYFIYDYFVNKSINIGFKKSLIPLCLTGIAFGLGAASKWIGLYAALGLALLFFLTKYQEYKQFTKITARWKSSKTGWVKDFIPLYLTRTIVWSLLFFIVVPLVIYIASYFPSYLNVPGSSFQDVITNQQSMLSYHSGLTAQHAYSSSWYQWLPDYRPLYVFGGVDVPEGPQFASKIFIMGNPAIFWLGILAIPLAAYFAIKRRSRGMAVVLIAILFQVLPWVFVSRITFIYHIFSSLPFVIFCIIYVISCLTDKKISFKGTNISFNLEYVILTLYLLICAGLFAMFYPILSGWVVPQDYITNFLNWFHTQPNKFLKWDF